MEENNIKHEKENHGHGHKRHSKSDYAKYTVLLVIGFLTLVYSAVEIAFGLKIDSITLLTDGFHNLSDVVAILVALAAAYKSHAFSSHKMTYGWKRAEILGGLINGSFLLALCLYIVLESITKFINPTNFMRVPANSSSPNANNTGAADPNSSFYFIGIAASGVALNTFGTVLFFVTGHGHSHAAGDHGHSHGVHDDKDKKDKHSHSHGEKGHGHSHGEKEKHKHGHGEKKKDKDKHGHAHDETDKQHKHDQDEMHVQDDQVHEMTTVAVGQGEMKAPTLEELEHKHKALPFMDWNMYAVFVHYLGDAISSVFVLILGLLIHFFPTQSWINYLDPTVGLIIVIIILVTIVPLVRACTSILLHSVPHSIDVAGLQGRIEQIVGVASVHDLHVWQLDGTMIIASLHLIIYECTVPEYSQIVGRAKTALHECGIHSTTVQVEYMLPTSNEDDTQCGLICDENCSEDWCCKGDVRKRLIPKKGAANQMI